MSEQPTEVRNFARPGSDAPDRTPHSSLRQQRTLPWRTISLLGPPLILGFINLIDANFDKQKAVITGDQNYARLVGEGEEAKRIAIEEGNVVGLNKRNGILNEAQSHSAELVAGARGRSALLSQQGEANPILAVQAERTLDLMKPLHKVAENLLSVARLMLIEQAGIEISVDMNNLSNVRYVGPRRGGLSIDEKNEYIRRLQKESSFLARNARYARDAWDAATLVSTVREKACK